MLAPSKRWISVALGLSLAVLASGTAIAGFVRPEGATPKVDSLAIAYKPCSTDTPTVHGGPATSPLTGKPSCDPVKSSPFLTAGTPDVNGQPAQFVGLVRQDVMTLPGPSDIKLTARMKDVRCDVPIAGNPALCTPNGPGPPAYKGRTDVVVPIDVTDNCNYPGGSGGGPCPAPPTSGTLASMVVLDFPMPCAVPATPNIGGDCNVTTSWNARYPGIVPPPSPPLNGSRMNIEVREVRVTDGSDTGGSSPNNSTFAISGLFSP
jgi:hypothetical protein